jgi:hypothetical protein
MAIAPALSTTFFRELTRPREAIIRYSEPGTVLTHDCDALLGELFAYYVERMFAQEQDYQEEIMRKRVADVLRSHKLLTQFKLGHRVGNEEYGIKFPLVTEPRIGFYDKAIKPLNLAQSDTTKIYDHGDEWLSRLRRLRKLNLAPKNLLFTVNQPPRDSRRYAAFEEVCRELRAQDTRVVHATEEEAIVGFASSEVA